MIKPFTYLDASVKTYTSLALGRNTAVVGENRSYKTSIYDAIQLALLGRHLEVGAQPWKINKVLAIDPTQGLHATLTGDSGRAEYKLDATQGTAQARHILTGDDLIQFQNDEDLRMRMLPILHASELIDFESKETRSILCKYFGKGILDSVEMPLGLSQEQRDLWDEANCEKCNADVITTIVDMISWFDSESRGSSRKATVLEKAGNAQVSFVGLERIQPLTLEYDKIRLYESRAADRALREEKRAEVTKLEREIAAFDAVETAPMEHEIEKARLDWLTAAAQLEDETARLSYGQKLLQNVKASVEDKSNLCPVGKVHDDLPLIASVLEQRIQTREKSQLEAIEQERSAKNVLEQKQGALAKKRDVGKKEALSNQLAVARSILVYLDVRLKNDQEPKVSSSTLKREIDELQGALAKKREVELARAEAQKLRNRSEYAKTCKKQAELLLMRSMSLVAERALPLINKNMIPGLTAVIEMNEDRAALAVTGRDGRPHGKGAMSGREKGALMIAVSSAIRGPYSLLALDDTSLTGFDEKGVRDLCYTLRDAAQQDLFTQSLLIWTRPHEIPRDADFTIIERTPADGPPVSQEVELT